MKTDNITEISSSVRLMTIKEVAKFFNLSDYAIRNGVKNGEIPRCPNAPEPPVVCLCCQCGKEIYEGDEIYDINDEKWCEECVNGCRSTAELEEQEYDHDD